MKKLALTIAIVLGMTVGAFAQTQNGGLFQMGPERQYDSYDYGNTRGSGLFLPNQHGLEGDSDGAPLGTGTVLLLGFGAAYAMTKRNKK